MIVTNIKGSVLFIVKNIEKTLTRVPSTADYVIWKKRYRSVNQVAWNFQDNTVRVILMSGSEENEK